MIKMSDPSIAHMQLLSKQMDEIYRSMKPETQVLSQWEEDQAFSILGVLELFSSDIQGYVESLAFSQLPPDVNSVLAHVNQLNAFQIDYFAAWYFDSWKDYPQIRLYIE